jgi:glutathione S-transferase
MITLYGHPYSPNTRKVHWALEELGAPYQYRTIDLPRREQKQPDYLRLNPNGRVPTLVDGEFTLYESNAILWYVADKLGGGKLVPDPPYLRALVHQWVYWQTSDLGPAMGRPWWMKTVGPLLGKPVDEARHQELVAAAQAPLGILDAHLVGKPLVVGTELSIADIALGESVALAPQAGIDLAPFAHLGAWLARLAERLAFKKTRPPTR